MINTLKIIQHNVLNWNSQKNNLNNIYSNLDPDIILINSHGLNKSTPLKIFNYIVHKRNNSEELHDEVAVAIKQGINYQLLDEFNDEFIAIKTDTSLGPIVIATTYLPPRRNYLPLPDMYKLANFHIPTYIIGDFNARHLIFNSTNNNAVGTSLQGMMALGKITHLGPDFPTFFGAASATTPDKVFGNNKIFHNHHLQQGPMTGSDHLLI